jgi:hypothetical protein
MSTLTNNHELIPGFNKIISYIHDMDTKNIKLSNLVETNQIQLKEKNDKIIRQYEIINELKGIIQNIDSSLVVNY